jgi:hypothetical protein
MTLWRSAGTLPNRFAGGSCFHNFTGRAVHWGKKIVFSLSKIIGYFGKA